MLTTSRWIQIGPHQKSLIHYRQLEITIYSGATMLTTETGPVTTQPLPPLVGIAARTIADDLDRPVFVAGIQGDDRLLVLQQGGSIVAVDPESGQIEPFLDISDRVGDFGIEQGLLGLALHPGFADNGRLFAYYTDLEENSRLVEFSGGESSADPASERLAGGRLLPRRRVGQRGPEPVLRKLLSLV